MEVYVHRSGSIHVTGVTIMAVSNYPSELPESITGASPATIQTAMRKAFADKVLPPLINTQVGTPESRELLEKLIAELMAKFPQWGRLEAINRIQIAQGD